MTVLADGDQASRVTLLELFPCPRGCNHIPPLTEISKKPLQIGGESKQIHPKCQVRGLVRFHFWFKIINAYPSGKEFDKDMEQSGEQLGHLPACAGGRFGVLMQITNQHGAGL
jgi:hypothetical protein